MTSLEEGLPVTSLDDKTGSPGKLFLLHLANTPLQDRSVRKHFITVAGRLITASSLVGRLAAGDITAALVRHHDNARAANGGVCRLGRYHQLLQLASVISYHWRVDDGKLICQLLTAIADCESTLERLLAGAIFGTRVTYLISGTKSDFDDDEECLSSAAFFLGHACAQGLSITVNYDPARRRGWERTYRAVDLPLISYDVIPPLHAAVRMQRPTAVLIFLQCGARLDFVPVTGMFGADVRCKLVASLCQVLNSEVTKHIEEGRPYNEAAILCLRLLLRSLPQATLKIIAAAAKVSTPATAAFPSLCQAIGNGDGDDFDAVSAVHYTIVAQEPRLRRFVGVAQLRHLSRCAVRRRLSQLDQLPAGIRRLPLPDLLRDYVDLVDD